MLYEEKFGKNQQSEKVIEVICFSSSYAFTEILSKKPHSIILTSGTLSPLDTFEQEIGLSFKYKLVNTHVIDKQ